MRQKTAARTRPAGVAAFPFSSGDCYAAFSAILFLRRQVINPIPANPISNITQVDGSGMAATASEEAKIP
jgi:hypothetical protein